MADIKCPRCGNEKYFSIKIDLKSCEHCLQLFKVIRLRQLIKCIPYVPKEEKR